MSNFHPKYGVSNSENFYTRLREIVDTPSLGIPHDYRVVSRNDLVVLLHQFERLERESRREAELIEQTRRLSHMLERDRTAVAACVTNLRNVIKGHEWLRLGRGSYEWDDDRWRDEFSQALDGIAEQIESLASVASDMEGCPKSAEEIIEARRGLNERSTKSTGIELIEKERHRQVSQEGWSPEHDDTHDSGELSQAAAIYAGVASAQARGASAEEFNIDFAMEIGWPWDKRWWKPKGPLRDLVRAGALIAAEIDRLQRQGQTDEDNAINESIKK